METVKVDIQKLQLLNDRIAQTIEALNQVRLSVHGIQHTTSQVGGGVGYGPFAGQNPFIAQQTPWGGAGYGSYSNMGYGTPTFGQPFTPFVQGLSHTTAPWTQSPWTQSPWTQSQFGGIAHSTMDPMWQMRAAQTFPFAQVPYVY